MASIFQKPNFDGKVLVAKGSSLFSTFKHSQFQKEMFFFSDQANNTIDQNKSMDPKSKFLDLMLSRQSHQIILLESIQQQQNPISQQNTTYKIRHIDYKNNIDLRELQSK